MCLVRRRHLQAGGRRLPPSPAATLLPGLTGRVGGQSILAGENNPTVARVKDEQRRRP